MPTAAPTEKEKWAERIARKAEAHLEEVLIENLASKSYQLGAGSAFATDAHAVLARHRDAVACIRKALEAS